MRAFLGTSRFLFTGPEKWNALGLGATAMFATALVYTGDKRTGTFQLGSRRYTLRRVAFPKSPPAEWFVVDLFENAERAGVSRDVLTQGLSRALARRGFRVTVLRDMAVEYGTKATQDHIEDAIRGAKP